MSILRGAIVSFLSYLESQHAQNDQDRMDDVHLVQPSLLLESS